MADVSWQAGWKCCEYLQVQKRQGMQTVLTCPANWFSYSRHEHKNRETSVSKSTVVLEGFFSSLAMKILVSS
jgi:hypothetical protein